MLACWPEAQKACVLFGFRATLMRLLETQASVASQASAMAHPIPAGANVRIERRSKQRLPTRHGLRIAGTDSSPTCACQRATSSTFNMEADLCASLQRLSYWGSSARTMELEVLEMSLKASRPKVSLS